MFDYLLKKIEEAEFQTLPFKHIYIEDFFNETQFNEIINANEIKINSLKNDKELFEKLNENGYKPIKFPGCITNEKEYTKWHKNKKINKSNNQTSCESFGMTYRLYESKSTVIKKLKEFIESTEFQDVLKKKFNLDKKYIYDCGLQKYVDGYEISPHPDIRRKALTYMININPSKDSEVNNHHTHYLKFKPEFNYVKEFWKGNNKIDRCWVPWDWCCSQKQQKNNNSIVIFAPSNESMHAVKSDYDHLAYQRTQLYGNLWHMVEEKLPTVNWETLDLKENYKKEYENTYSTIFKKYIPNELFAIKSKLLKRKEGERNIFK